MLKKIKQGLVVLASTGLAFVASATVEPTAGSEYISAASSNIDLVTPIIATVAAIALGWTGVTVGRAWFRRAK